MRKEIKRTFLAGLDLYDYWLIWQIYNILPQNPFPVLEKNELLTSVFFNLSLHKLMWGEWLSRADEKACLKIAYYLFMAFEIPENNWRTYNASSCSAVQKYGAIPCFFIFCFQT